MNSRNGRHGGQAVGRTVFLVVLAAACCCAAWPWHGLPLAAGIAAASAGTVSLLPHARPATAVACVLLVAAQAAGPGQLLRAAATGLLLLAVLTLREHLDLPDPTGRAQAVVVSAQALCATATAALVTLAATGLLPAWTAAPGALCAAAALLITRTPAQKRHSDESTGAP